MELWVRSQDKTFLRKVNTIGIVKGRDFWSIDENLTVPFGKYKTKERAIEVLDEIQNKLNIRHCDDVGIQFILINEMTPIIYEMPEE